MTNAQTRLANQDDIGRIIWNINNPRKGYRIAAISHDGRTCYGNPVRRVAPGAIPQSDPNGFSMQLTATKINWQANTWPIPTPKETIS